MDSGGLAQTVGPRITRMGSKFAVTIARVAPQARWIVIAAKRLTPTVRSEGSLLAADGTSTSGMQMVVCWDRASELLVSTARMHTSSRLVPAGQPWAAGV